MQFYLSYDCLNCFTALYSISYNSQKPVQGMPDFPHWKTGHKNITLFLVHITLFLVKIPGFWKHLLKLLVEKQFKVTAVQMRFSLNLEGDCISNKVWLDTRVIWPIFSLQAIIIIENTV